MAITEPFVVEPGQWIVDLEHDQVVRVMGPWPDAPDHWVVAQTVGSLPSFSRLDSSRITVRSGDHLRTGEVIHSDDVAVDTATLIADYLAQHPDATQSEIAGAFSISSKTVQRSTAWKSRKTETETIEHDDPLSLFDGQPRTVNAVGRRKPDDDYGFMWVRIYEPIAEQLKSGWSPECRVRLAYIGSTHELVAMSLDDPQVKTDKRFNTEGL